MLYYVTALNPKVNSPPFAATVAALCLYSIYQVNPVHQFYEPIALNSKLSLNLLP